MDEFRKPFDYFEDKGIGGILLILFFMLIAIEPLMGIAAVFFGYHHINDNILRIIFMCLAALYILFAISSGILLKRKSRIAVRFTKIFLIFRAAFMAPYLYVNMRLQILDIKYDKAYPLYEKMYGSIVTSFIIALSYIVVFSAVWFAYLCKSKRVSDLFMSKDTGTKSGA